MYQLRQATPIYEFGGFRLDVARRQMHGFGGVLSFMLKGGFDAVLAFLPRLRYAHLAANLGAVETIAGPPATTSHVECTPEEREAMGIPEGLIRYSVGIEETEDFIVNTINLLPVSLQVVGHRNIISFRRTPVARRGSSAATSLVQARNQAGILQEAFGFLQQDQTIQGLAEEDSRPGRERRSFCFLKCS